MALWASILSKLPVISHKAMRIPPRFSHTSDANLEVHYVPRHAIAFVEQNKEQLQRATQDQIWFRAGITSTQTAPLDHQAQIIEVSGLQLIARPMQGIPGHQNPLEGLHPTVFLAQEYEQTLQSH